MLTPVRFGPAPQAAFVRTALAWRPAPRRATLAQAPTQVLAPSITAPARPRPPFIDSALVALILDAIGTVGTAFIAYQLTFPKGLPDPRDPSRRVKVLPSRWAWIIGGISVLMGVKTVFDLYHLREY